MSARDHANDSSLIEGAAGGDRETAVTIMEQTYAHRGLASMALDQADEIVSLRRLLHRWLIEASAVGLGPRAQLTQDTLDAVGMPPDHPGGSR